MLSLAGVYWAQDCDQPSLEVHQEAPDKSLTNTSKRWGLFHAFSLVSALRTISKMGKTKANRHTQSPRVRE